MGVIHSYCTRCNNCLSYFIEYENDGIECDVCSHFNTDREIKGTMFKYDGPYYVEHGVLKIWGEQEMKIEKLEVGKLYIASGTKEDMTCLRSTCTNLTRYYEGGHQFRCSDDDYCGMTFTAGYLEGPAALTYREADKPDSNSLKLV